jgi:hypothetical protein
MEKKELTQELVASKLLFPLWTGIDPNYKDHYRTEVWQHFENNIRVSAYTSKLNIFLAKFMRLMSVEIMAKFTKDVNEIMDSGQDKIILRWLRDETTYLVLQVRMMRQEINDSYKETE